MSCRTCNAVDICNGSRGELDSDSSKNKFYLNDRTFPAQQKRKVCSIKVNRFVQIPKIKNNVNGFHNLNLFHLVRSGSIKKKEFKNNPQIIQDRSWKFSVIFIHCMTLEICKPSTFIAHDI